MYNKDFCSFENNILEFISCKGNRTCWSCGHKIKKGTPCLSKKHRTRSFIMCPDCGAEFYFRATTKQIIISKEETERIEKELEQAKKLKLDRIQEEVEKHFFDRISLLLKDYSSERIIREVLKRNRK